MSRNRKPREMAKYENSLSSLALNLGRAEGMTTGGSYLSAYNTIAHSNNYSLITLNRIILTYLYTGNGIFQTAIQLPVQDAIGKGIEIDSGELSNEDIDAVFEYWEEHGIWETLLNGWTWGRLYGGAAILVNTNQDPESELDIKRLQNSPIELYDIDRWQLDTNAVLFDEWDSYLQGSGEHIYLEGQ